MPINMRTNKLYTINYDNWAKELYKITIFKDKNIQKRYVDTWIQKFRELDENSSNLLNLESINLILKEKDEDTEIFQLPIWYGSNCIYIHFPVSRIIKEIEDSEIYANDLCDININELKDKRRNIHWTQTEDQVDIKSQPILMAKMPIGEYYKWLVIDGNHRITDAISKGKKNIKAILINPYWMVENNLFCNIFDKYLYIFQNEFEALAMCINNDGYSDEKALELSYLY